MNVCFVSQEIGKVPSGVISVLNNLVSNWNKKDKIFILLNNTHWAFKPLRKSFYYNSNVELITLPFLLPSEDFSKLINSRSKIFHLFVKIIIRPKRWISFFYSVYWLKRWLTNKSIDAVISHNGGWPGGELNRWAIWASKISNIKYRYLVIHNVPWKVPYFYQIFEYFRNRSIEKNCSEIISVSESCAQSLKLGAYFKKTPRVIYNGITIPKEQKKYKSKWNGETVKIAFIGELHKRKGVHILLKSLDCINSPCELQIYGNGEKEYTNYLNTIAKSRKWETKFFGYCDNIQKIYPQIDILVLPSLYLESFGMTLVEAMSYSIPTLSSDFGGMKEVAENNVTGFIVPKGDILKLGEKLNDLVLSYLLREKMGKKGRERVINKFSVEQMVIGYKSLLNDNG